MLYRGDLVGQLLHLQLHIVTAERKHLVRDIVHLGNDRRKPLVKLLCSRFNVRNTRQQLCRALQHIARRGLAVGT